MENANTEQTQHRYRINVSTTSKGAKSYDAAVELQGPNVTLVDVLREIDAMIEEMDARTQGPIC